MSTIGLLVVFLGSLVIELAAIVVVGRTVTRPWEEDSVRESFSPWSSGDAPHGTRHRMDDRLEHPRPVSIERLNPATRS